MKFEQLPNEIFLDVFEYFDGVELLVIFVDLNARFRALLYHQFPFYCFNIDRMSKRHLDFVCLQHLPHLTSQIVALKLNEGALTLDTVDRFTRLRSLSICNIYSNATKTKLLDQLPYLINLTHLYLRFDDATDQAAFDSQLLINVVWGLPNLVHYDQSGHVHSSDRSFALPSIVSLSLRHCAVSGQLFKGPTLDQLFQYTPNLRSLRTLVSFFDPTSDTPASSFPTLTKLIINVIECSPLTDFFSFLQRIPNLRHLDAKVSLAIIDGHRWQHIIRTYLPKLQTLQFTTEGNFETEDELDRLIDTFRSSFWITERRWFVRCYVEDSRFHLQTASKQDYRYHQAFSHRFKSTEPKHSLTDFFNQMTSMDSETFDNYSFPTGVCFPRLAHLSLKFPIAEHFSQVVTSFKQLQCLSVSSYANRFAGQLQTIVDRAPRLRSLSIFQEASESLDMLLEQLANSSIDYLALYGHILNEDECRALSRSPLLTRCKSLNLRVEQWMNALILVNTTFKLQSLSLPLGTNEDSIEWIQNQLPSSCLVSRSMDYVTGVQIYLSHVYLAE